MDPKFCRNHSISHRFQDECAFALTQKFKMAAKSGGKVIFAKKSLVDSVYILWDKNFIEIALSRTVSEISFFYVSRRNSRWPPKVAGK